MDRGVKIVLAAGVVSAGIGLALLFRHQAPQAGPPGPAAYERLVLRDRTGPPDTRQIRPTPPTTSIESSPAATRPTSSPRRLGTPISPLEPGQPPPPLARHYPAFPQAIDPRWGTSMGMGLPRLDPPDHSPPTHTIVDGDTLAALAERYLGSADRAVEIYEANRDLLEDPEVLPIGVELKIPPESDRTEPSSG